MQSKTTSNFLIPTRRFGRTEIDMPILSLGGMRFQQSWKDLKANEIENDQQKNLQNTISKAVKYGLNHMETARQYGTSEMQLGWAMSQIKDQNRIKISNSDIYQYNIIPI